MEAIVTQLLILWVEDEPEVREALARDLQPFESIARIESAEDVEDARSVIASVVDRDTRLALALCDHLLPGMHGVDYLVELSNDPATAAARKVLVTGQAGLQDTIKAVNQAGLHYYIAKPWTAEQLHKVVRMQLTEFVIAHVDNLLPYVGVLDGERILSAIRSRQTDR
jgi:response regulator RpfG family c-di-GMP phosphodiesterase